MKTNLPPVTEKKNSKRSKKKRTVVVLISFFFVKRRGNILVRLKKCVGKCFFKLLLYKLTVFSAAVKVRLKILLKNKKNKQKK